MCVIGIANSDRARDVCEIFCEAQRRRYVSEALGEERRRRGVCENFEIKKFPPLLRQICANSYAVKFAHSHQKCKLSAQSHTNYHSRLVCTQIHTFRYANVSRSQKHELDVQGARLGVRQSAGEAQVHAEQRQQRERVPGEQEACVANSHFKKAAATCTYKGELSSRDAQLGHILDTSWTHLEHVLDAF